MSNKPYDDTLKDLIEDDRLAVRTIILLLRQEANAKSLTGVYEVCEPGETEPYQRFRYHVVRLWEQPMAPFLTAGLGVLPLATLTDEASTNLEPVVRRVNDRLKAEAQPDVVGKMMAATFLLMGLRYEQGLIEQLYSGVKEMEESSTYQLILSRGRVQQAREILVRIGRKKFGEPDEMQQITIDGINDSQRLEDLVDRVSTAVDWGDLLKA